MLNPALKRLMQPGEDIESIAPSSFLFGNSPAELKMFGSTRKASVQRAIAQAAAIDGSQAVIEFKLDGTIVTANRNFLDAMGYSLGEIHGKHHSMFVAPAEREGAAYREFWAKLNRGEFQAAQYKRFGKGGKEIWIQASYNPILDAKGKPAGVI